MKIRRKEVFSIPNVLSYFRILLIPVFTVLYFNADLPAEYFMAGIIILVSGFTDFMDGLIARRFDMVTELGKLIDPVADKLTQLAIIICLIHRYQGMLLLAGIFVCKELFMGINGLLLLRRGKKLGGAKWFGKVATAVFYITTIVFIALPELPLEWANGLMLVTGFFLLLSFALYTPVFAKMYHDSAPGTEEAGAEKDKNHV